jgi:hypothetical protein
MPDAIAHPAQKLRRMNVRLTQLPFEPDGEAFRCPALDPGLEGELCILLA